MDTLRSDEEKRFAPMAEKTPDDGRIVPGAGEAAQTTKPTGDGTATNVCHTTDTVIYTSPEFAEVENTVDHYRKLKPGEPCKLDQEDRTI